MIERSLSGGGSLLALVLAEYSCKRWTCDLLDAVSFAPLGLTPQYPVT